MAAQARTAKPARSKRSLRSADVVSDEAHEPAPLVNADVHSEGFRKVREARRSELVEDYVELIDDLIAHDGEARQVEIAARLGVTQPTVAKMLKRLADDGLVVSKRYRGVFLTEAGQQMARESRERHQVVESFLIALGVDADIARQDAEGIEHHVSAQTLEAMRTFTDNKA